MTQHMSTFDQDEFDELELGEADDADALDDFVEQAAADFADEFVFMPDDRFRVCRSGCTRSPVQFPFNTICRIVQPGGGFGTGTLIAPNVVLSAKHVLTSGGTFACGPLGGTWTPHASLSITVGRDGATSTARPLSMNVPAARIRTHPSLDVGVAILPRAFRGPSRFMSLQARSDAATVGATLTLAGYPGDKPVNTLWAASDRVSSVTATHLYHRIDLTPGESGGPIWLLGPGETRLILAVQSGHWATGSNPNCGARITCDVIRRILGWCREFRVRAPRVDGLRRCPS